ncbi:dephospho-CoA kinase [Vibrio sp. SM6]|uniref:Dephospho-CoA kinase n=1 Tax=Vibrio agarilyticus TaxID=2726741 RepID=A0A7X8TQG4_9VIBR|nr:dephospho-CoA kinase [Vibrio agarilyticus]NLS12796.1 dephospho-CoA kinase [Vibrio agarilyticus]
MSFVVGLTGGIASGKTTVANRFHQAYGIDLVDADVIARQVVEPKTQGLQQIAAHFGPQILNRDGTLDRAQLRERIFNNDADKQWLNELMHPLIRTQMQRALTQTQSPYALLVVPLLIENQLQSLCDRILVVDVDEQTQIARTCARDGVSAEQVQAILAAQATRAQRLSYATEVVDNLTDQHTLFDKIDQLHRKYLAISTQNGPK